MENIYHKFCASKVKSSKLIVLSDQHYFWTQATSVQYKMMETIKLIIATVCSLSHPQTGSYWEVNKQRWQVNIFLVPSVVSCVPGYLMCSSFEQVFAFRLCPSLLTWPDADTGRETPRWAGFQHLLSNVHTEMHFVSCKMVPPFPAARTCLDLSTLSVLISFNTGSS